jgi:dTDP-L-rhamnose 4-epimerase
MRLGLPINIFEDGYESRDFVHVSDVVNAINQCLVEPLVGFEAINIGSGRATTVQTVALLLRRLLGSDSPIRVTGDFRVGDIRHCYADLTNARKLIGFAPMVDLEVGMERFVRWVVSQEAFEDQSVQAQQQLGGLGLGRAHSS